jgi:hypothetical protein
MFVFILMRMADSDGGNWLPGEKRWPEGQPTASSSVLWVGLQADALWIRF